MSSLIHSFYNQLQRRFSSSTTTTTTTTITSLLPRDDETSYSANSILSNGDISFGGSTFSMHDIKMIRITGISSACCSIVFGLLAIYFYLMINPRKRVFRHKLIIMLIGFDYLKALSLLIYPLVNLRHPSAGYNRKYINTLGFFTSLSIEGADFMILWFAIHISLLIFRSKRTSKNTGNIEGGLYFFRYYVYSLTFILPVLLACLGFINDQGYQPDISYSYLTVDPVWFRIVLSWVPRFCIVVVIFCIYGYVYYHVLKEYKKVSGSMEILNPDQRRSVSEVWGETWWYKLFKLLLILVFPDVQINAKLHGQGLNTEADLQNLEKLRIDDLENNMEFLQKNTKHLQTLIEDESSIENNQNNQNNQNFYQIQSNHITSDERIKNIQLEVGLDVQRILHQEAMEKFQIRRIQILNQMKVIFIYPLSYILLWLFPFIAQCIQFNRGEVYYKIVWLNCVSAFFQAFNCTIDTIVFLFREQPWNLTIEKTEKELGLVNSYPILRQYANKLNLPGYKLPETINKDITITKPINDTSSYTLSNISDTNNKLKSSPISHNIYGDKDTTIENDQKLHDDYNHNDNDNDETDNNNSNDDDNVEMSLSEILAPTGYSSRSVSMSTNNNNNNNNNSHTHNIILNNDNSRRNSKISWSGPQSQQLNNTGTGIGIPSSIKTRKSSQYSSNSSTSHNNDSSESDNNNNNEQQQFYYTLPEIKENELSAEQKGIKNVFQDWGFKRKLSNNFQPTKAHRKFESIEPLSSIPLIGNNNNNNNTNNNNSSSSSSSQPNVTTPQSTDFSTYNSSTNTKVDNNHNNNHNNKKNNNNDDDDDDDEIDIMDFLKFSK